MRAVDFLIPVNRVLLYTFTGVSEAVSNIVTTVFRENLVGLGFL